MRNLLIICFVLPFFVSAQVDAGRKTVEQLCSPEFHGRGYVNGGDSLAANYIQKAFTDAGCKSFKGGMFQTFEFYVNAFPGKMNLSIDEKTLVPGQDFVVDPGSGGGFETNVVYYKIRLTDVLVPKSMRKRISELTAANGRANSKFGFVFNMPEFSGDTLKQAQQLLAEFTELFPTIELTDKKFTWSVANSQTKFPYFQVQTSALDLNKMDWKVSYIVDAKLSLHKARNVVAMVPAKKKSKRYFVFSAHYDHLGQMGANTYFPGGNDNASGTALLLELAKHYALNRPDVNIVFIAFAGEEAGLLGSNYYTEHPIFPMESIDFLFNLDIMGSGEDGATVVNATLFPEQFTALTTINTEKQYLAKIGARGEAANSDHYFFTKKGVPAFFMYTMGPNKHYHDIYDTYNELSFNEFNDIFHLMVDFQKAMSVKKKK